MNVKYLMLKNSCVIHVNCKTYIVTSDSDKYQKVQECISSGLLQNIPAILDINETYKKVGIEMQKDGQVYLNGISLDAIIPKD